MQADVQGMASLSADVNKAKGAMGEETVEGIVSQKLPELVLEMKDEEIVKLTEKWQRDWNTSGKKTEWDKACEDNEKYWLGKHFEGPLDKDVGRAMVDNLIFESLETYLPQITRRNPEPLVTLDASEKDENGNENPKHSKYVAKVKGRLADLADKNKMRLKLQKAGRHWAVYLLGVAKMGWDMDKDIPTFRIVRPKKLILDPDATIDEDGYTGNRVGEYRKMEASKLISITKDQNPKAEQIITDLVKSDMGTEVQFIEWWTPEYMCWKLDKEILLKTKNPHWNYDAQEMQQNVDDYGVMTETPLEKPGINHFEIPKMPYTFMSVFNLGDQPMDKTSLIGQNLANQDLLNKRNKQIDRNADRMNGGMVISKGRSGLNDSQAKTASNALRKGGVVVIPDGAPREAIDTYQTPPLPPDVFNQLADTRNRMRDIFGTRGSSGAGIQSETTVRGKILNRGLDTDRIGGGVSEYLEQFADDIYNWLVQLLYVYDTAFQFVPGAEPPKVIVSVKEGSLLPKDSITIANQAIELATAGKMAVVDMYKRLEYPNPEEMAANVWLEANAPQLLFENNPKVQQAIMAQQMAAQAAAQQKTQEENDRIMLKGSMDIEKQNARSKPTEQSVLAEVPQDNMGMPA